MDDSSKSNPLQRSATTDGVRRDEKASNPFHRTATSGANPNEGGESSGIIYGLFKGQTDKWESNKLFQEMDADGSKNLSYHEISRFISTNDKLWNSLAEKLEQPPAAARHVATRVAMELASGLKGQEALETELTKEQFHQFRKDYILDPKGSQEYFHRAVFANFDMDGNAALDKEELNQFLDTIYESGIVTAPGVPPLPKKDRLKSVMLAKYDGSRQSFGLSFSDLQGVISGEGAEELTQAVEEHEAIKAKRAEMERLKAEAAKAEAEWLEAERLKAQALVTKKEALEREDWTFCQWVEHKTNKRLCGKSGGCIIQ